MRHFQKRSRYIFTRQQELDEALAVSTDGKSTHVLSLFLQV